MPHDILYKILSKLTLKNIITFLDSSKEYEDIKQIIITKLKRICDENEEKINKLIYEIYNDNKINIKKYNKFKKEFIINYKNAHILKWNSERIYIDSLDLSDNKLETLPESFGNLVIGCDLILLDNELKSLPKNFGNIVIGGDLDLYKNELTSLPESFGNLVIGGWLDLSFNQIKTLPESFVNLNKIEVNLNLSNNELSELPESFGNLVLEGDLDLSYNQLSELPESFGNLVIKGDIYVYLIINLVNYQKVLEIL